MGIVTRPLRFVWAVAPLLAAACALAAPLHAQVYSRGLYGNGAGYPTPTFRTEDVPPIVFAGLNAYRTNGADDAVRTWVKNGPLDGSTAAASQASYLRSVGDYYGIVQGLDVADLRQPVARVRVVYFTLNYKKGPLFVRFTLYRTDDAWVVTSFVFNTEIGQVFPADLQ